MTPGKALELVRKLEAKHGPLAVRWALAYLHAEQAHETCDTTKDTAYAYFHGVRPYSFLRTKEVADDVANFDDADDVQTFLGYVEGNSGLKPNQKDATLVLCHTEENPENDCAACVFAYFDGTPTEAQLTKAGARKDGFTKPKLAPNAVSRRAGLERWMLSQAV